MSGVSPATDAASEHDHATRVLEAAFGELLSGMRRTYGRIARRIDPRMLPGHYKVFSLIARRPGASISALADSAELDKAQISRTVRDLEEFGLVTRLADPHDGRSHVLQLTPLGTDRQSALRDPNTNTIVQPLAAWDLPHIRHLTQLIAALVRAQRPTSHLPIWNHGCDTAPAVRGGDMTGTPEDREREEAISELSGEFGALFTRVRRVFRDAADTVAPGLQPVAYQALSRICRTEGLTVGALAELLDIDKSVASRAVRDVEKLDLIVRHPDPADGRSSILQATDLGRARLEAARTPMRATFNDTLQDWSLDDLRSLTNLLRALTAPDISSPASEK